MAMMESAVRHFNLNARAVLSESLAKGSFTILKCLASRGIATPIQQGRLQLMRGRHRARGVGIDGFGTFASSLAA